MTKFFIFLFLANVAWSQALACTQEFAPVCGYWMHTPKTQSFQNKCKMTEAGAKFRHDGSCHQESNKQTPPPSTGKASGK